MYRQDIYDMKKNVYKIGTDKQFLGFYEQSIFRVEIIRVFVSFRI